MKKRKSTSFVRRISLNMLTAILFANILFYVSTFGFFFVTTVRSTRINGRNVLSSNVEMVSQYFHDLDRIASAVIFNNRINNILKAETDTNNAMETLKTIEEMFYHSRDDLELILYKENTPGKAYSINTSNDYSYITNYRYSRWYNALQKTDQSRILLTNIHAEEGSNNNEYVHALVYRISDLYGTDMVGYLRIDLNLQRLSKKLLMNFEDIQGIAIYSEDGEILFSNGEGVSFAEDLFTLAKADGAVHEESRKQDFLFLEQAGTSGLTVAVSISKAGMVRQLLLLTLVGLTLFLFSSAFCLHYVNRSTGILTDNLNRLEGGMHDLQHGNLDARVDAAADDEIERVLLRFNKMASRINTLIESEETKTSLLKDAQIQALQQQINPHFIYNTLETVMGMASVGMQDEIIEICTCMSSMMRYSTRMDRTSTLKDEILQVTNYGRILELRMGGAFHIDIQADEQCMDAVMTRFSLEPIMENSINRGMANVSAGGTICLSTKLVGERIHIVIEDNGCGIPPVKLQELQAMLKTETEDVLKEMRNSQRTGLLNVHSRLRLQFGDTYSISMDSGLGKGTRTEIVIPYLKTEVKL